MLKLKWVFLLFILIGFGFLYKRIFHEFPDDWANSSEDKLPIVYSDNCDITVFGLEKLHSFDSRKYGKIATHLTDEVGIPKTKFHAPGKIGNEDLLLVHTQRYLDSLHNPAVVANIAGLEVLSKVPDFVLQERLLDAMRFATNGTVLGAELAMEEGWAINLAGGYHHAKAESSGGFSFFADVPIAIKKQWKGNSKLKVLIVDFDAHQGNGNESIFKADKRIFILDIYNRNNYPRDEEAKKYIDFDRPIGNLSSDEYLDVVKESLPLAIKNSQPDLIIYNSGSDALLGDPLGKLNLTREGLIKRDAFVFEYALKSKIPILMVLSGGYSPVSAEVVGESIENILKNVIGINVN